jgi:hypothetical protein
MPTTPTLEKLRQEDHKFKANWHYIPCLKQTNKQKKKTRPGNVAQ